MSKYDPRTHVFEYGGTMPKERREENALAAFCTRMRRLYRAAYTVVPLDHALAQGLVLTTEGTTVDGVIATSGGMIAVELLAYSPVSDRGDVLTLDYQFRQAIKPTIYDDLASKPCSLYFGYKEVRRGGPEYATKRSVPVEREYKALTEELQLLLRNLPPFDGAFQTVRFVPPRLVAMRNPHAREQYLDATRHPMCATHFDHLRLQRLSSRMIPQVDSNLSGGFIGLDEAWTRSYLKKKATISLRQSHVRANGLPLWLIVHSDGFAIHQTIPEAHRVRTIALAREVLAENPHGFDRVYWLDRTSNASAAWIGRVR